MSKTGLWSLFKMATQYNMNTCQEQRAIPEKNASQTGDRDGEDMEFPMVLENVEILGVN